MQHVTAKNLARACHKMLPILAATDIETQQALARLCDPSAEFKRDDGLAIATALLLELRSRRPPNRRHQP
jgi:hypothetical protein